MLNVGQDSLRRNVSFLKYLNSLWDKLKKDILVNAKDVFVNVKGKKLKLDIAKIRTS